MKNDTRQDHEIARDEIAEILSKLGVTGRHECQGTGYDASGWKHTAYTIRFAVPQPEGHRMPRSIPWKQGMGIKDAPHWQSCIASACADFLSVKGRTFPDWADEMGMNSDSIKDKAVFDTCLALGPQLSGLPVKRLAELASRL